MPITKAVTHITLTVVCDTCQHQVVIGAGSEYLAVDQLRTEGWKFRYPDAACPACTLPERVPGRTYIDKG